MDKAKEIELYVDLTKRYYAFSYHTYYPGGGFSDIVFTSDNFDECITNLSCDPGDYHEIFDNHTKKLYDIQLPLILD